MNAFAKFLLHREAVASTRMSRDPDMQTHYYDTGEIAMTEPTFDYEAADAAVAETPEDEVSNTASASEARTWLLNNPSELPEGVTVGARGRLSVKAREAFTTATGREVK